MSEKRLTPKEAIKQECRYCLNAAKLPGPVGCDNESCNLNKTELSLLKRIKTHCIECIPEQSSQGVRRCDGKVLNPEPHVCPLHPYRLGHNPARAGIGRHDMAEIRKKR